MKKLFAALSLVAVAMVGVVVTPDTGSAVPAFARQTGNPCWACHFQYFPKLNAFGRNFKLNGFTDATVDLIEDDFLSIPAVMPVSFVSKVRYVLTSTPDVEGDEIGSDRGEWEVPDEAVIFFGGRAGENMGYAIEWDDGWNNAKLLIPLIKGDFVAGLFVGTSDGAGVQGSTELYNTGLYKAQRAFENRTAAYASSKIGIEGGATGLGAFGGNDMVQFTLALWGPLYGGDGGIDAAFDMMQYARITVSPSVGDWNLMVGLAYFGGTGTVAEAIGSEELVSLDADAMVVDFQAQGEMGAMTLEITGMYVTAGGDDIAWPIAGIEADGMSFTVVLGIAPQFGVKGAYRATTIDDVEDTSIGGGAYFNIMQNVTLSIEYFSLDGDGEAHESKMYAMLFSGF